MSDRILVFRVDIADARYYTRQPAMVADDLADMQRGTTAPRDVRITPILMREDEYDILTGETYAAREVIGKTSVVIIRNRSPRGAL